MTEMTRWDFKVSSNADVRAFLAEQGQSDGDLARFVEEAVNRELLRQTLAEVHAENAEEEAMQLINEEIAAYRRERRAGAHP